MNLLWLIKTITPRDTLDLLILSYLIYRALIIIQGTKAFKSLNGLLVLLLLYAASNSFNLGGTYWVLDKFFVYIVLAIIILFQEDIRNGLARAGDILPSFRRTQSVSVQEDIIRTSFILASRRIGGLIAIEQNASLEETISTGTLLHANVSQELLTAIFLPTSPLHDGAIIVRNEKIISAKCIIPISTNKDVSKFYGTRHRAALGLSEKTDAIVIIISEERGTVSIAQNGNLEMMTSNKQLRERLQELSLKTGSLL